MSPLPIVAIERRKRMLEQPPTVETHALLLEEMPFLDDAELSLPFRPDAPAPRSVNVIAWNAERCPRPEAASRFLGRHQADLLLLTEMDWGMARSGQRHTARELAARLGCGYLFGVEYLELGLGDAVERETFYGRENEVGYHGAAILFRHDPLEWRVVRLERSAGWFDGKRGERRVGGRIALLARVRLAPRAVTFASVHLESDSDPADRCAQMAKVFDAIEAFGPGEPALIGGDLNTYSVSCAELHSDEAMERAILADPGRLLDPTRHEPLFALAAQHGYAWRACNRMDLPTQRLSQRASSGRRRMKVDWFLSRGLAARSPRRIPADDPHDGVGLSDHDAISVTVEMPAREPADAPRALGARGAPSNAGDGTA